MGSLSATIGWRTAFADPPIEGAFDYGFSGRWSASAAYKGRGRQTHDAIHWLAREFLWHFFGRTASQHRHNYAFSHDSFNDMIFINNVVINVPQN